MKTKKVDGSKYKVSNRTHSYKQIKVEAEALILKIIFISIVVGIAILFYS